MFGDINKVTILGNAVREPEVRTTNDGKAVANISIVTNRKYKQGEEWKEIAEFHDVTLWKSAEIVGPRILKGTRLYVEGRLAYKSYEKDGVKKYKTEIVVEKIILLSKYKGEEVEKDRHHDDDDTEVSTTIGF